MHETSFPEMIVFLEKQKEMYLKVRRCWADDIIMIYSENKDTTFKIYNQYVCIYITIVEVAIFKP